MVAGRCLQRRAAAVAVIAAASAAFLAVAAAVPAAVGAGAATAADTTDLRYRPAFRYFFFSSFFPVFSPGCTGYLVNSFATPLLIRFSDFSGVGLVRSVSLPRPRHTS